MLMGRLIGFLPGQFKSIFWVFFWRFWRYNWRIFEFFQVRIGECLIFEVEFGHNFGDSGRNVRIRSNFGWFRSRYVKIVSFLVIMFRFKVKIVQIFGYKVKIFHNFGVSGRNAGLGQILVNWGQICPNGDFSGQNFSFSYKKLSNFWL